MGKLQGVLMQPNGLQKVLSHEKVVTSRASNPLVKEFCDAVEEKGPMAGLAFMGRPDVMSALGEVLPGVIDEVSASSAGAGSVSVTSDNDPMNRIICHLG